MKNKNVLILPVSALSVLCIFLLVYIASLNLNAFNNSFYKTEFKKYDIYGEFPDKDIDKINSGLLLYIRGIDEQYNQELFNEKEISHLKDVKILFQKVSILNYSVIMLLIIFLTLLFFLDKKRFLKNLSLVLFFSGLFTLLITIALLFFTLVGFGSLFTQFHHIFFPQGNWLFSPSDNIIRLYPSAFFYDMAKKIFTSIIFYGNILIGVGILLFRK